MSGKKRLGSTNVKGIRSLMRWAGITNNVVDDLGGRKILLLIEIRIRNYRR